MSSIITFSDLHAIARARPLVTLAVSHAVVAGAYVWVASGGKPLRFLYKKLFQTLVAAVPSSVLEAENDKARAKIERSVIGKTIDGEQRFCELPEQGEAICSVAGVCA